MASANVESVFSGAGRISARSQTMDPLLLSHYAFCHYNYKYDWLRPTLKEILKAYKKLYGAGARNSDAESDDSSGGEEEREEEEGEEEEGGEEQVRAVGGCDLSARPQAGVSGGRLRSQRTASTRTVRTVQYCIFQCYQLCWVLSAQCKCQSVHSVLSAVTVL